MSISGPAPAFFIMQPIPFHTLTSNFTSLPDDFGKSFSPSTKISSSPSLKSLMYDLTQVESPHVSARSLSEQHLLPLLSHPLILPISYRDHIKYKNYITYEVKEMKDFVETCLNFRSSSSYL